MGIIIKHSDSSKINNMKKTNFFNENKVLISGLLFAVVITVNELTGAGEANGKAIAFAAALAATAFLAKNLRGQWATIATMLGTSLTTYVAMEQSGNISWVQLIGQGLALYLGATMPPAKPKEYEETPIIVEAKKEAEAMIEVKKT